MTSRVTREPVGNEATLRISTGPAKVCTTANPLLVNPVTVPGSMLPRPSGTGDTPGDTSVGAEIGAPTCACPGSWYPAKLTEKRVPAGNDPTAGPDGVGGPKGAEAEEPGKGVEDEAEGCVAAAFAPSDIGSVGAKGRRSVAVKEPPISGNDSDVIVDGGTDPGAKEPGWPGAAPA